MARIRLMTQGEVGSELSTLIAELKNCGIVVSVVRAHSTEANFPYPLAHFFGDDGKVREDAGEEAVTMLFKQILQGKRDATA